MKYKKNTKKRNANYSKKKLAISRFRPKQNFKYNTEKGILLAKIRVQIPSTIPNLAIYNQAYAPSLSNIPSAEVDAYRQLWDQFRLCAMKIVVAPHGNLANVGANTSTMRLYSVIDNTDANLLSSVDNALEYRNCHQTLMTKSHKRYCKLSTVTLARDSANTPVLKIEKPRWLQTAIQIIGGTSYDDSLVQHLGIKMISDTNNNANSVNWVTYFTYYIEFKTRK